MQAGMINNISKLIFCMILILNQSIFLQGQQFSRYPSSFPGMQQGGTSWGDFDNDGDLDFVMNGIPDSGPPATKLFRNDNGIFSEVATSLPSLYGSSLAWGDFDNDNDLDLLLCGNNIQGEGKTLIYLNSNGVFSEMQAGLVGITTGRAIWLDYDNDGWLDVLVVGDSSYTTPVTRLYRNNGNGSFTAQSTGLDAFTNGFVTTGDYDNDGDQDILMSGLYDYYYLTRLYRNDHGVFVNSGLAFDSVGYGDGVFADYDKDGHPDIFYMGSNGQGSYDFRIYHNNGDGSFTDVPNNFEGEWSGQISVSDVNNDGYPDIGVTGALCCGDALTMVYLNMGDGTFTELSSPLPDMSSSQICFGDFDNDGDIDILLSGSCHDSAGMPAAFIFQNQISGGGFNQNSPPSVPTDLQTQVIDHKVTFTWAASNDNTTPSPALTYNLRIGTLPVNQLIMSPLSDPVNGFQKVYGLGNTGQDTSWNLNIQTSGTYYWSIQAIDLSGASSQYASVATFSIGNAGITPLQDENQACIVMPNPAVNELNIWIASSWQNALFKIINTNGCTIKKGALSGDHTCLNLTDLTSGLYFLTIEKDGRFMQQKVVKE